MRLFIALLLHFLFIPCFSQGQADNWYFGDYAGIRFNADGSVSALTDGQMKVSEGCSTISDCNGLLLFYTDGENVWNKNHQIMVNGTGLFGRDTSTQAATIIKKPGAANIYYIFTSSVATAMGNSCYTEVDMALQGGLGEVTNKNILLFTNTTEKLTIAKHANNIDYWAISYNRNTHYFHVYLVSSAGVSSVPVLSYYENIDWSGGMKVSPDGTKLAVCNFSATALLFDFDNSNGKISSSPEELTPDNEYPYSVEFSPDSKLLYVNCYPKTYQLDLSASNIKDSRISIAASVASNSGTLQLAPNGKIYYAITGALKLGVINKPNVRGAGCDFDREGVDLNGKKCQAGLPSFCPSTVMPSFTSKNFCLGSNTEFEINTNLDTSTIHWDFGDGSTSSDPNPSHQYAAAGNYTVTVSGIAAADLCPLVKTISIAQPPIATPLSSISVCGAAGTNYSLSQLDAAILGGQSVLAYGVAYFSSLPDAVNHNNGLSKTDFALAFGNNAVYAKVYLLNNLNCYDIELLAISLFSPPDFMIEETYFICQNGSVLISLPSTFSSYIWTDETTPSSTIIGTNSMISISQPGSYSVTVSETHGSMTCSTTKNFSVANSNPATFLDIKTHDFSDNNTITVEVTGDGDYEFSIDGFTYQDSNFFSNVKSGQYTVYVRDKNGCGIIQRNVYLLGYPKFFTPNGDGYNDYWHVNFSMKEPNMLVNIFDRYGKFITNFDGLKSGWDGKLNGKPVPSDDYWFVITRQDGTIFKGHFTLKR